MYVGGMICIVLCGISTLVIKTLFLICTFDDNKNDFLQLCTDNDVVRIDIPATRCDNVLYYWSTELISRNSTTNKMSVGQVVKPKKYLGEK